MGSAEAARLPGGVQVWTATLDLPAPDLARLAATLSADEHRRAQRLDGTARRRFVAARGSLRARLAEALDAEPAALRFRYGEQGKPELDHAWSASGLRFSLSHADELLVLALARGRGVGADVERVRPVSGMERVAARIFPPPDLARWQALPPEQRLPEFFRLWTRQEALAKVRGQGLWRVAARTADQEGITLHALDAPPGYVAAVAVEGADAGGGE